MQKITPDWPAPECIQAFTTTRQGGVSASPWDSFNLGSNCGDQQQHVISNREILRAALPAEPNWLEQVHGSEVIRVGEFQNIAVADASWSDQTGTVCAVLTADCLPVLLCTTNGSHIAAAHCGWRSLAAGVLENTITAMQVDPRDLLVWFGPAISAVNYEVGSEVYQAFVEKHPQNKQAFTASRAGHWQADLIMLARLSLGSLGVYAFYGGQYCTYAEQQFYSYRRDGQTGRMVSLICRQDE